jgi:hydroxymethylbilane synthase
LATWQATHVQGLLKDHGFEAELTYIKSEGDIDLKTPLYEMGVQGIFTRTLDAALLNGHIDIAVHSMKDVPTRLPDGIVQAAVLPRATFRDILVQREARSLDSLAEIPALIATSSTRRRAQWLHRYPHHTIENLRGNVNSRMQKLSDSNWQGAIFAEAGLERIGLRPAEAIVLDWMLPAPAQGAIVIVCREGDHFMLDACRRLNDATTAFCTGIEKDFLRTLRGGCTAPIGALAEVIDDVVHFKGNLLSPDGRKIFEVERSATIAEAADLGNICGQAILDQGGLHIIQQLH